MFEATKIVAASALAAVAMSAGAQADTRPYISLGGNIIFEDSDRESDTGFGGKIAFGKRLNTYLGYELQGFYNDFDGGSSGLADWEDYGVGADVYGRFTAPMREMVGVYLHREAVQLMGPRREPGPGEE